MSDYTDKAREIGWRWFGVGHHDAAALASEVKEALREAHEAGRMAGTAARRFHLGDRVTKTKGSSWTGRVVGFYSTTLTPVGYAIESENEPGSVQIYPEAALAFAEIRAGFDPAFGAEAGHE